MSEFEEQLLTLLTEIKIELQSIHQLIDESLSSNSEKSSELISNLFGILGQEPK
ncbi:hypothetical protein [Paenibacillus cremeus]|uniref:hypothetical protein n=1 Tax=Paenibacillus cremeus TaxID=2163881 RepID=UPI001644EF83|nr:hypothetical protein [Paenibacillus cremeus]